MTAFSSSRLPFSMLRCCCQTLVCRRLHMGEAVLTTLTRKSWMLVQLQWGCAFYPFLVDCWTNMSAGGDSVCQKRSGRQRLGLLFVGDLPTAIDHDPSRQTLEVFHGLDVLFKVWTDFNVFPLFQLLVSPSLLCKNLRRLFNFNSENSLHPSVPHVISDLETI